MWIKDINVYGYNSKYIILYICINIIVLYKLIFLSYGKILFLCIKVISYFISSRRGEKNYKIVIKIIIIERFLILYYVCKYLFGNYMY